MAEPTIIFEVNEGSEGTPSWAAVDTAIRFTGPDGVGDPHAAPIGDGDEVFFDGAAAPDDGETWHDASSDAIIAAAGRNTNQNAIRVRETGAADGTADPPELTAYDDPTDAAARTNPTVWVLAGTAGSSTISLVRAVETTAGAPGGGWTGQVHDGAPGEGAALDGNKSGEKVVCASALAASGNKTFNIAAALPHDATPGQTTFSWALQYTYT